MATPSTHVLLVATPTNSKYMCAVCGHYYEFTTVYSTNVVVCTLIRILESNPHSNYSTSWVTHVLFVATTEYSVCGHSYEL